MNHFLKSHPKANLHLSASFVHHTILDAVRDIRKMDDKMQCDVSNGWCRWPVFMSVGKSPVGVWLGKASGLVSPLVLDGVRCAEITE